jgi:hypothetical protein
MRVVIYLSSSIWKIHTYFFPEIERKFLINGSNSTSVNIVTKLRTVLPGFGQQLGRIFFLFLLESTFFLVYWTRQDRWIQTELAFTLAKNATKQNPFEIIPPQTTRKENNSKTEETLARAVVTLETERIKGPNPWYLWWWWIPGPWMWPLTLIQCRSEHCVGTAFIPRYVYMD